MAYTGRVDAEPLTLPFRGETALSRHTSRQGALSAAERAGRQALALLALYRAYGPLSDAEAASRMAVERTTINARRNELVKLGLVTDVDTQKNPTTGVRNTRWGLVTR